VKVPDYPQVVRPGLSEPEKRQLVRSLNVARRHLSADDRRSLIAGAIRDDPAMSDRRLAVLLGVSPTTVGAVRGELESAGEVSRLDTRTDARGVERPASQPVRRPSITVHSPRAAARALEALRAMGDDVPSRPLDLRTAERLARGATYSRMRDATPPVEHVDGGGFELRCGDFADVLDDVETGSVDLVLTDPPYVAEFDERWRDLSALGARVLRPGGVAVFYTGHHNLPDVMTQLGEHLTWLWHIAIVQPGHESRMNAPQVHNGHRDVLLFSNGAYTPTRWLRDTLTLTSAPDKALHPWQQSLDAPRYIVDLLSSPGGLVCDPCVGSGTFGVAALEAGRRFVGVDVDAVTLGVAERRLRGEDGAAETVL
jgi:site-specific DNA-methyltransferase (adenine-specific)